MLKEHRLRCAHCRCGHACKRCQGKSLSDKSSSHFYDSGKNLVGLSISAGRDLAGEWSQLRHLFRDGDINARLCHGFVTNPRMKKVFAHAWVENCGFVLDDSSIGQGNTVLDARLLAPSSELVISKFQRSVINRLKLRTVGDVLQAEESTFKKAKGVADVRARQIHNAAQEAVMEYLSG